MIGNSAAYSRYSRREVALSSKKSSSRNNFIAHCHSRGKARPPSLRVTRGAQLRQVSRISRDSPRRPKSERQDDSGLISNESNLEIRGNTGGRGLCKDRDRDRLPLCAAYLCPEVCVDGESERLCIICSLRANPANAKTREQQFTSDAARSNQ